MAGNKNAKNDQNGQKKEEDLTTILDKSQRADLTLLVADITESMRRLVVENFDAKAGLDQALMQKDGMTEDEKMMTADVSKADVEKYDRQRKLKAEYEKDLASEDMKKLKEDCLSAYDDWRQQVILRVGQVVNDEVTAQDQVNKSHADDARPKAPQNTIGKITDTPQRNSNLKFKDLFPPTKTPLTKLSMDRRTLIVHAILLLLLSLEHYPATSRILLLNLTSSLKLPLRTFEQDEYITAKGLLEGAKELSASEEISKRIDENKETRKRNVNYAKLAGAAIIGVAGGLAAPLVAAGIGSVATGLGLGTTAAAGYLGSVASSSIVVGSLFGAYGGRMSGQMMDKYAREVEDFEFMRVHASHDSKKTSEDPEEGAKQASDNDHKLRVTICISGWLTEKEEVLRPWRVLGTGSEVFALKFELEALLNLGNAMDGFVQSAAWGYAQKELIQRTIFAELMGAMWPLGLLKVARVVDNPFSVAKSRAEKAGEVLADALINRCQGERPVTLIGYSLGARAIFFCLQSLAKRKAFNLVENVVLMGAPCPSDTSDWRTVRTAVSGRLINVYSRNDYLLGLLYRTSAIQYGVAGLQPVEGLAGVENVDVSEEVDGHLRYRFLVGGILQKIGFEDIDMNAVEEEQAALKKIIEEEKKNSLQAQRKRLLRQESYKQEKKEVDEEAEAEHEASEIEKAAQEKTKRSLISRAIEWWYSPRVPNTRDASKILDNVQRAATNPADVRATAGDTVKDIQDSTSSIAQRVYAALPNIPYMSNKDATTQAATNIQKTAQDLKKTAADSGQSYTEMAQSYYKSLPSMPSVNIPGYSKPKPPPASKPAQATKDAGEPAKKVVDATTETVGTTVKNTTNLRNNPATKQVRQAPIIHQAVDNDPGVTQTLGKASDVVSTTTANTTDKATGLIGSLTDTAGKAGGKAVDTVDDGVKKAASSVPGTKSQDKPTPDTKNNPQPQQQDSQQTYTDYAKSYIPSSLPSLPSWNRKSSNRPAPPKLERKGSSQQAPNKAQSPAPARSDRPAPPKLQRKGSSQQGAARGPPPKLGPRKASENKSPSPSPRQSSPAGGKENMPNIAQTMSGGAATVMRKGSETAGQAVKTGQQGAGQVGSGAQGAAKKGQEGVGRVTSTAQQAVAKSADAAGGAAGAAKSAGGQAAGAGQKAAGAVARGAQQVAGKGVEGAGQAADGAQQIAGKGAEVETQAVQKGGQTLQGGSEAATGAVGGLFGKGRKMVGFGG